MTVRVTEIDSLEGVRDLLSLWQRLLAETADADFFRTFEWLALHWRHFASGLRLRILLVHDGDEAVGIWPLAVMRESTHWGPIRLLGYPLDSWGTSFAPLGPNPRRVVAAGLDHLRRTPRDWDCLDLRWTGQSVVGEVAAGFREAGVSVYLRPFAVRSWVDMDTGWETYWRSRAASLRSNVRRCERRLARWGRVEWIHCRPCPRDPRWDVFSLCERVAASSWQAAAATGNTLGSKPVRGLLGDLHFAATQRQGVSMHVLRVDGEPAAFAYNYLLDGRAFGLRTGFDPRFAAVSPGTLLMANMIRHGCEVGDHSLDLGETRAAYKRQWRTRSEPTYQLCHFPSGGWRPHLLRIRHWLRSSEAAQGSSC